MQTKSRIFSFGGRILSALEASRTIANASVGFLLSRSEIRAQRNREFSNALQEKFLDEQGKNRSTESNQAMSDFGAKADTIAVSRRGS
jgi:hypothetical protein